MGMLADLTDILADNEVETYLGVTSCILSFIAGLSYYMSKMKPHPSSIMIRIFFSEAFSSVFLTIWKYNPTKFIERFQLDQRVINSPL